jgi:hypothetical protein
VYVNVTVPVGSPTEELTVAVKTTAWPSVVVVVFADSAVVVSAGVTVTEEAAEDEPSFAESPL